MNLTHVERCVEEALLRVGSDRISLSELSRARGPNWIAHFAVTRSPRMVALESLAFAVHGSATEEDVTAMIERRLREAMPVWLGEGEGRK
jgi:hypothetical protein